MGHISLIAEELVKLLSRCPPDLYAQIQDSYNHSEWEAFVEGSLRETKARDTQPLAGGKPMSLMTVLHTGDGAQSSKESEDSSSDSDDDGGDGFGQKAEMGGGFGEPLTRTHAQDGFVPRGGNGEYDGFDDNDDNNVSPERAERDKRKSRADGSISVLGCEPRCETSCRFVR